MTQEDLGVRLRPVAIDSELAAAVAAPYRIDRRPTESAIDFERRRRREWHAARAERAGGPRAVNREIAGVRCRVHSPPGVPRAAVIWLHGGGWVYGEPEGDDSMLARFAGEVGVTVIGVDYRLAPEHPYPSALMDVVSVANALTGDGHAILLAGASAGANLAAGASLLLRDTGRAAPAGQLLVCPPLHDEATDDDEGPLRRSDLTAFWTQYLSGESADEYAAPGRAADLFGLAPTYLYTTSSDPLRVEAWEFARRLVSAGVETEARFVPGGYHGFEYEAPDSAFSQRAVDEWVKVLDRMVRRLEENQATH